VATNHNICYAQSRDGGKTWTTADGKPLTVPITADSGEVALPIPEKSELINQTTIAADAAGHPYIATYYREAGSTVPQFHVVYHDGAAWRSSQIGNRTTPFSLAGAGTKRIPVSRPLIVADGGTPSRLHVVFRDAERGERVTVATTADVTKNDWAVTDLTPPPPQGDAYGYWEPSADLSLWARDRVLHLFLQKTDQLDGGDNVTRGDLPPTRVYVLEYTP
jgi:hypothetical protein